MSVDVQPTQKRILALSNGMQAKITSATKISRSEGTTLEESTVLELQFPSPVNLDEITRTAWRVSALFEFLIGSRVESRAYHLPTTHKRMWNDQEREVIAEFWFTPPFRKRNKKLKPLDYDLFTCEKWSSVPLENLLNLVSKGSDELIFLADKIQSTEDFESPVAQSYGELLGCLEYFDKKTFGSGADQNFKSDLEKLRLIVEKHALEPQKNLFRRISGSASNNFSLLKRLERLHKIWEEDGFKGNPELSRVRDLRNLIPHGKGLKVTGAIAQEMAHLLQYLSAMGRYHVLRKLGFSADEIGMAFLRHPHRYGMFVPHRLIPS